MTGVKITFSCGHWGLDPMITLERAQELVAASNKIFPCPECEVPVKAIMAEVGEAFV
jgi:hypothetical protein